MDKATLRMYVTEPGCPAVGCWPMVKRDLGCARRYLRWKTWALVVYFLLNALWWAIWGLIKGVRDHLQARCYLRGWTWLGLLNTALGCALNRVLVRCVDEARRTVAWRWDKATDHPPAEG